MFLCCGHTRHYFGIVVLRLNSDIQCYQQWPHIKQHEMSCLMQKPTKWLCTSEDSDQPGHPPKSDQSSLSAWRKLGSFATHWAHSKDSDQTVRMPRLIWVFAGHSHFVGFVMRQLQCWQSYNNAVILALLCLVWYCICPFKIHLTQTARTKTLNWLEAVYRFDHFKIAPTNDILSHDVTVIQWLTSCHKNHMSHIT